MINSLFTRIFNAIFPKNFVCDLCGEEIFNGENLCEECKQKIKVNDGYTCPVCGRKNFYNEICLECKEQAPQFDKAVSPLIYGEGTAMLIGRFKSGAGYLKEYFCDLMAKSCEKLPEFDFITYVPMTKSAERKRGFNQSKLLAIGLAKRLNKPILRDVLVKTRKTEEQKTLSKRKRTENLKGCFRVHKRKECANARILLVDDVFTTGATADEACRLLRGAHAKNIYFVTAASVEYKLNRTVELD